MDEKKPLLEGHQSPSANGEASGGNKGGDSGIILNFKGNKDGDYLSPMEGESKHAPQLQQPQHSQRPPLKGILKAPASSAVRRASLEKQSSSGSESDSESDDDLDEYEDEVAEELSNKVSISDLLGPEDGIGKPIPPPPRNLTIELPYLFRFLLFLNGTEFPVWFGLPGSGASGGSSGWCGWCGLWGKGGRGPWEKGSISAILQYVWTLLHFVAVTYVTIIANVDVYYEFRTYGLPVQFFTIPIPLLVLAMNFYFQRTNSFQGLMKLLNAASTSYIAEAIAKKRHRAIASMAVGRRRFKGGSKRRSGEVVPSVEGVGVDVESGVVSSEEDSEDDEDEVGGGEFREDSFFAGDVTRFTIHVRKQRRRRSSNLFGKKVHQAIGGDQKKRRRRPVRDPRSVNEDDEIVRRANRKRRRQKGGMLVEEEEIIDDSGSEGEGVDLLPGEDGEVWYSQPLLDASQVFTLRFFSVGAIILSLIASAATILSIVFPFISDHSDDKALVIANYVACGLVFWWYLSLFSFLFILLAISALVIRFVKTVIYVQKLGRATMHTTIGYLQQLDKVITRASLQLQWPIALCLVCWIAAFFCLEYSYFFQSVLDDVSLYIVIPATFIAPVFVFFILKPTSDVTHSFARCRMILFRWATKYGRISGESQSMVYQDMAILRHLLAKSGWYVFGVQLTRRILIIASLVSICVLVVGLQHIIHIQFA